MIHSKIKEFNKPNWGEWEEFNYHIKDGSIVIAGIVAESRYQTVEIEFLYVDNEYRKQGLAKQLLDYLEIVAKKQGMTSILVNTYSFQAPEFYLKMGYELLFKIEKAFGNVDQYYYRKQI
ncbi:GNAT family N-acetyltransferase [Macrococcus equipercicus]|uniref:GNAT family N-acetyltransferase n=1 Tax=Macrococcus equipercicus TaxID=69967 RepID=A0A9Q9BWS0_9STAP|nr:GNAT family N-acetyltransferase [Macrococcus equipercicus]